MGNVNYIKKQKQQEIKPISLSAEDLARLGNIFKAKGWKIENDDDNVFENFVKTLEFLEPQQRKLVLELTEQFNCIEVDKYYHCFVKAFDKCVEDMHNLVEGKVNIYIIPMMSVENFGKNKSSTFLYYFINAKSKLLNERYKEKAKICFVDVNSYDKIDSIYTNQFIKNNSRVCLIDDFIGSGSTAKSAIDYLNDNSIVSKEKISVVTIVAMQQGIDLLKTINVNTYCNLLCQKAITGTGDREQERISIMNSISEKIGADEKYYLGYEQSEALIKLVRTPNNTFPIYWLKKKNKFPPFLR